MAGCGALGALLFDREALRSGEPESEASKLQAHGPSVSQPHRGADSWLCSLAPIAHQGAAPPTGPPTAEQPPQSLWQDRAFIDAECPRLLARRLLVVGSWQGNVFPLTTVLQCEDLALLHPPRRGHAQRVNHIVQVDAHAPLRAHFDRSGGALGYHASLVDPGIANEGEEQTPCLPLGVEGRGPALEQDPRGNPIAK
jgi:hypothetical protein